MSTPAFVTVPSLCTQQYHPAPIRQRTWRFVSPNLSFEESAILNAQCHQIRLNLAVNGRMIDLLPALGHHLLEIAVADRVPAIPANEGSGSAQTQTAVL